MNKLTDSELISVHQLRQRMPAAWDQLYQVGGQRTYRVLYHVTKAEQRVLEDLNQIVWLAAIETVDSFDPSRGSAVDWVLGIARHKGLSYLRSKYRTRVFAVGSSHDLPPIEQRDAPDEDIGERRAILRACIESLPENWQFVLRQKYEMGLSVKEIANLAGGGVKAIESILSRARTRLRQMVREITESGSEL